jgi:hypothetical protein
LLASGRRQGEAIEWREWRAATATNWQLEIASALVSGGETGA